MRFIYTLIIAAVVLVVSVSNTQAQQISINGGLNPNFTKGSHFGGLITFQLKDRWNYSFGYQFTKYKDFFGETNSIQPSFHKEYKDDVTFIPFPELNRGISVEKSLYDFRPSEMYHQFVIYLGYNFLNSRDFFVNVFFGPHYSSNRVYNRSFYVYPAKIVVNEGDEPRDLAFYDYHVFRSWDVGLSTRLDIQYKLFENLFLGFNSIVSYDFIEEGGVIALGGSVTCKF